jgi:hypothetical protein
MINYEICQETAPAEQNLCDLRSIIHLAQEMVTGLGTGSILQRALPSSRADAADRPMSTNNTPPATIVLRRWFIVIALW